MMDMKEMFGKEYVVKVTDDGECITTGELIRCRDCVFSISDQERDDKLICIFYPNIRHYRIKDDYCSDAVKK